MKKFELPARMSPCLRIFISSLLDEIDPDNIVSEPVGLSAMLPAAALRKSYAGTQDKETHYESLREER